MSQSSDVSSQNTNLAASLTKSSAIALALQSAGFALAYLMQIFLIRLMGKDEYGVYEYVMTWSLCLGVLASLGLPRAIVRFINEYRTTEKWGLMRGVILGSWRLTIITGLSLGLIGTGLVLYIDYYNHFSYALILLFGIWIAPLQGLVLLQEDIARGVEDLVLAYVPTKIIWPILAMTVGWMLQQHDHSLKSTPMSWATLGTLLGVLILQASSIWLTVSDKIKIASSVYEHRAWLKVSLPLLFHQAFRVLLVQTDVLMIGFLVDTTAVGEYSPASKTALWVSFVLQAINLASAPKFAALYSQDKKYELQELLTTTTRWIFRSSSIVAILLIIFAKPILNIFGLISAESYWVLEILVIGQLANSFSGSVGNLLSMTGYQNKLMIVSGCTALLNLCLDIMLISLWGIIGAAVATAVTISIWNIWLLVITIRNLEVNPTVFRL